jgi:hypothetical protein
MAVHEARVINGICAGFLHECEHEPLVNGIRFYFNGKDAECTNGRAVALWIKDISLRDAQRRNSIVG